MKEYNLAITEDYEGFFTAQVIEEPWIIFCVRDKQEIEAMLMKAFNRARGENKELFDLMISPSKKKCLIPKYLDDLPTFFVYASCRQLEVRCPFEIKKDSLIKSIATQKFTVFEETLN